MDAGQNALLAEVISLSPEVRRVKLLSAGKAALMLDVSVSTLEKRRKQLKPPPPAPNLAGGKKGEEVKYLASTLVEYIAGEPISLRGRGTQFDPDVVDAFIDIADDFRSIALNYPD